MIHIKTADFDYESIIADSDFKQNEGKQVGGKVTFKGEVTNKMIDIVDYLLSYVSCAKNFEDKNLNIISKKEIEEKIEKFNRILEKYL